MICCAYPNAPSLVGPSVLKAGWVGSVLETVVLENIYQHRILAYYAFYYANIFDKSLAVKMRIKPFVWLL